MVASEVFTYTLNSDYKLPIERKFTNTRFHTCVNHIYYKSFRVSPQMLNYFGKIQGKLDPLGWAYTYNYFMSSAYHLTCFTYMNRILSHYVVLNTE